MKRVHRGPIGGDECNVHVWLPHRMPRRRRRMPDALTDDALGERRDDIRVIDALVVMRRVRGSKMKKPVAISILPSLASTMERKGELPCRAGFAFGRSCSERDGRYLLQGRALSPDAGRPRPTPYQPES